MGFEPRRSDERGLHEAMDRLLDAQTPDTPAVREAIRQSWLRSQALTVRPDRAESQFIREPNDEATLVRAAAPILEHLADNLATDPVAVILTSADGVVTQRFSSDAKINSALDDVRLARGYSYSEQFVGTNGIGTALEMRMPALVLGREHYADGLATLSCAGVPILHPVSGKLLGVLNLTTWAANGGSLLMTLAKTAGNQIRDRILSQAHEAETAPFNAFLKASRRTRQAILAIAGDQVLMNQQLRGALDVQDLLSLVEYAVDAKSGSGSNTSVALLPSGRKVRLTGEISTDTDGQGHVFTVQLLEQSRTAGTAPASRRNLPGLAGKSASWRHSQQEVERCYQDGDWFLVAGEEGSGRTALLRSVATQHGAAARQQVLDRANFRTSEEYLHAIADALEEDDFEVLIRNISSVEREVLDPLAGLLQTAVGAGRLTATMGSSLAHPDFKASIQPFFEHTVSVSPLRHRIEDLNELVPHLLQKVGNGADVSFSPEAMQHLTKFNWPGNVAQLRRILGEVILRQRSGVAGIEQLPAEVRALSRYRLTPMEALQRDAIVHALAENEGNMAKAAAALGMSRATIYRRKRAYGIT